MAAKGFESLCLHQFGPEIHWDFRPFFYWLEEGREEKEVPAADIRRFMEVVQNAPQKAYPSLGLGENIRFQGPFVSGAALLHDGFVLHLSGFQNQGSDEIKPKVPYQIFSQRRRKI